MIFIENKYTKWYNNIVSAAQARTAVTGYTEKHHIIPKSLGGTNNKSNLVVLTAREHFICHWLLTKMTTGQDYYRMAKALHRMTCVNEFHLRYKVSSRKFEQIRIAAGRAHSALIKGTQVGKNNPFYGKTHSQETKDKIGALAKLRPRQVRTAESKIKMSLALKGRPLSQAHKDAIKASWDKEARSGTNHPGFGKQATEETRNKMKVSSQIRWDDKERERVSNLRAKDPVFVCPKCSKNIKGKGNLTQHTRRCDKYSITLEK